MDAFRAKDVLELFRLKRRASFQRFAELLFAQSGAIFEATQFARPREVSRHTIVNCLAVLDATFVVPVVRPFSGGGTAEVVAAPRVYAFDTGFVCRHRGWRELRREDLGALFEHLVLNELHAQLESRATIRYWRAKAGPAVDFVVEHHRRHGQPVAIECKWSAGSFEPQDTGVRRRYPGSRNLVVAADVTRSYARRYGGIRVRLVGLTDLPRMERERGTTLKTGRDWGSTAA